MHSRLRDKSIGFLLTLAATGKKVQVIQTSYIIVSPLETSLLQVFCNTTDVMVKASKLRFTQVRQHKGARALGNTPLCFQYLAIYSLCVILSSMLSTNYALCMCDVKEEAQINCQ